MLTVYINNDSQDLPLNTSGIEYTEFSEGNDQFIFTKGNPTVDDGQPIPSQSELISAGIQLENPPAQIIVDKYFLADLDADELKEIFNMGNQNKRYVIAFDFDSSTGSEPVFEVWDDNTLSTITSTILGGGTPSNSFFRGITTTDGLPGANWITTANKLAGSSSGNFLYLNNQNGFLVSADTLYCNLAIVVPASQTTGFSANPVFVVKWLDN